MSVRILLGDVRAKLAELPAESVNCVVTSPPYWALRDYGTATWQGGDPACDHRSPTMRVGRDEQRAMLAGSAATNSAQLLNAVSAGKCGKCGAIRSDSQLGLEPTPQEHVAAMVEVFREVKRVLRPDGVCFVNYGDSYAGAVNGRSAADGKAAGGDDRTFRDKPIRNVVGSIKEKDLCLIPERFVLAMQDDGWWVRSRFPWLKRNSMPESISDRPATATEFMFMFTKNGNRRLWWRHIETREWRNIKPPVEYRWRFIDTRELVAIEPEGWRTARGADGRRLWMRIHAWEGFDYWYDADAVRKALAPASVGRLAQDVASQEGSDHANGGRKTNGKMKAVGGHQRRGSTPRHTPYTTSCDQSGLDGVGRGERNFRNADLFFESIAGPHGLITDADGLPLAIDVPPQPFREAHFATFPPKLIEPLIKAGCPKGGTVLDPFGGAGTTGLVADRLQRSAILIELNPEYAAIAHKRIDGESPLFAPMAAE